MARQNINIGTTSNDGTGDTLRAAFDKVNDNFIEVYEDVTSLSNTAFSGDYDDLTNAPDLSNVLVANNGIVTVDITGSVYGSNGSILVDANTRSFFYDPENPSDWSNTAPVTIGEAIDRLAVVVKILNGGTGA